MRGGCGKILLHLVVVPSDVGADTGDEVESEDTVGVVACDGVDNVELHVESRGDVIPLEGVIVLESTFAFPSVGTEAQCPYGCELVADVDLCSRRDELVEVSLTKRVSTTGLQLQEPMRFEFICFSSLSLCGHA